LLLKAATTEVVGFVQCLQELLVADVLDVGLGPVVGLRIV
jgi:hypothetical protein